MKLNQKLSFKISITSMCTYAYQVLSTLQINPEFKLLIHEHWQKYTTVNHNIH